MLRGQTSTAVRDRASSDFLARRGIAHRLVPDAVHALEVLRAAEPDAGSGVAIVQLSRAVLRAARPRRRGRAARRERAAARPQLRLLLAGTATGHDYRADHETLARDLRRAAPRADVAHPRHAPAARARRPHPAARVVIGTSLHVRIVAGAYGVPRVTLTKRKPTEYARSWDSDMPYDVALDDLDHAIEAAVARAPAAGDRRAPPTSRCARTSTWPGSRPR